MTNDYNNTAYYLKKRGEMCYRYVDCEGCPLSANNNGKALTCNEYEKGFPEEAIAAVREWHEKEEKKKKEKKYTYLGDFLTKFPNVNKTSDGYPKDERTSKRIPACSLYPEISNKCIECSDCGSCWDMNKED